MGLYVSHECWTGAYSAFSRWRDELARAAGYSFHAPSEAEKIEGFYRPYPDIRWDLFEAKNYQGEWDLSSHPGIDPLLFLIVHSDCDGLIHPAQAAPLAGRLEEILPLLDESKSGGHIQSMQGNTQKFINGLREAVRLGEDVEFW